MIGTASPTAYSLPSHLWPPQARSITDSIAAVRSNLSVCLQAPTGSGKTEVAIQLMLWAQSMGMDSSFYVNRRLLIAQTAERFLRAGMWTGIRAAEYEDCYDGDAPYQICSADTVYSRVHKRKTWAPLDGGLMVVDEGHLQKTKAMRAILDDHQARGGQVVILTATPVGMMKWADKLIVSGRMQEYRDCNAIVPAVVKTITQPDLSKVKRNATGEYILDGKKKKIYTQTIVGDVLNRYKLYNPDGRPTMMYAPGKPESVWLTDQFCKAGINFCHVDADDAVVDGIRAPLTRTLWQEILDRYTAGDIKGISSRFKCREGLDLPTTYCCILATPIGSLASYIQTVGRVLRYSAETPDQVIVIDHGGNYIRHGSPNDDRPWQAWWGLPERVVSEAFTDSIKDRDTPEPIRCPNCESERKGGITCPICGHTHAKSKRTVVMEDGTMVEKDGHIIRPRYVKREANTDELWAKMFWGFRKNKVNKSFRQMYAFFAHTHGYFPPKDIPFMPRGKENWQSKVHSVRMNELTSKS